MKKISAEELVLRFYEQESEWILFEAIKAENELAAKYKLNGLQMMRFLGLLIYLNNPKIFEEVNNEFTKVRESSVTN